MGISRIVWFFIGHHAHYLEEKIGVKKLLKMEIVLFPALLIMTAVFSNPYLVGLIFSLIVGYHWGRHQIIINCFLNSFIDNPHYKATLLSIKNQIQITFMFIISFGVGFLMKISYQLGYAVTGIVLFIILLMLYQSLRKLKEVRKKEIVTLENVSRY